MERCEHGVTHDEDVGQLPPGSGPTGSGAVAESRSWIGELGGIGLFAASAAYALGYSAQSAYYGAFGLTPEQVGVDKISALLRITPLAALFGVATPLAVAAALAGGRWIQREVLDLIPGKIFKKLPLIVTFPALLVLPVLLIASDMRERYYSPPISGIRDDSYLMWESILEVILVWLSISVVWWIFDRFVGPIFATFGAAVAVVGVACLALWQFVDVPARTLRDEPASAFSTRLIMVGLSPAYAKVEWKDIGKAPRYIRDNPGRIFLVLGETPDRHMLYEYCEKNIFTVSGSDAYVIRTLPPGRASVAKQEEWSHQAFPC